MTEYSRPKCSFCSEEAKVWDPIHGPVCRHSDQHGFCREEGKICPKCNRLVSRLKPLFFVGGPMICFNCRLKEWDDDI